MKIIDAQVHIWKDATSTPSGIHRKVQTFSAEEMLKEIGDINDLEIKRLRMELEMAKMGMPPGVDAH